MRLKHCCWVALPFAFAVLAGCGSSPSTPSSSPPPTVAPTASPTPSPTATPSPFGQCVPTPPPLVQFKIKIHDDNGFKKVLDSRPLVGPDPLYCQNYGSYAGKYCSPRPEGDPQAIACDVLVSGYATDTGRPGPVWSKDGQPCLPVGAGGGGVSDCENHPDNQFLVIARGPGNYLACSSSNSPYPNVCGGFSLCEDSSGNVFACP